MTICKKHSDQIHMWAAAGGATAAVLPVGLDAAALILQEVLMVIQIGSLFGVNIENATAQGILTATIASGIGVAAHATAVAGLEAANLGYPFTIPVKIGIAVGIIELVGRATYTYFESEKKKERE
ncbi:hypothetical protein [Microcoleus sp.]